MSTDTNPAYLALAELAGVSFKAAKGLPAQVDIKPYVSGIGFSLLDCKLIAMMGEFTEMLEVPDHTRLPGVKEWVKGVANVRGRLLPIIDMAVMFGGSLTLQRKLRRVLVIEQDELYSGLMVDQVFGMQHLPNDCFDQQVSGVPEEISSFVKGSYRHKDETWLLFSVKDLVNDPSFTNAAA